jgi:sugar phosphate isomerase/epimerase
MDKSKIAAQLYTLRDYLKTPAEVAKTLKKVKETGFDAVQLSGLAPVDPAELAKMLKGEGLICCATHEQAKQIVENPEKIADKLKILGCKHTAYPFPHNHPKTAKDYRKLAKVLSKAGKKLAAEGVVLSYHNHAGEFERFGRKTGLEIIYEESDPEYLKAELDTYWIQYGGGNPVAWCKKFPGRMPLLHLKEYGVVRNEVRMMELGTGSLNWKKIIAAAQNSGVEWYIIEQDVCLIDPFESLKISLSYLLTEV